MKKLILSLFICVLSTFCYGNEQMYYHKDNEGLEQTKRIGYTTNYGNGFGSVNRTYKFNTGMQTSLTSNYYSGTYTPYTSSGPRKSKERPYSGDAFEDFLDGLRIAFTSDWPKYVDDDYWDDLKSIDPDAYNYAVSWFESQGKHFPGDPDDPFADPLSDAPIPFIIILICCYVYYKYKPRRCSL